MAEKGAESPDVVLEERRNVTIIGPRKNLGDVIDDGSRRLALDPSRPMADSQSQGLGTFFESGRSSGTCTGCLSGAEVAILLHQGTPEESFIDGVVRLVVELILLALRIPFLGGLEEV